MVDVTREVVARSNKMAELAERDFSAFWEGLCERNSQWPGNTYGYMHRYMVEQDLPGGMRVVATGAAAH